jgi:DNA-binding MarR family transcriptional regulator
MAKQGKTGKSAQLMQALQSASRLVRTRLGARLLEEGMYAGQDRIIEILGAHGEMTAGELAKHIGVRPPTITKAISRLEGQGFVEKAQSASDGRQVRVRLTERGQGVTQRIGKLSRKLEKAALKGIDNKDLKAFRRVLAQIVENLAANEATQADEAGADPEGVDDITDTV